MNNSSGTFQAKGVDLGTTQQEDAVNRRVVAVVAVLGLLAFSAPPANARTDDRSKPVVYVHGFDATFSPGYDCHAYWDAMADTLEGMGHTDERVTVAYYALDYNCTYDSAHHGSHSTHHAGGHSGGSHTRNTSIRHLGYHLAWMIYDHFTSVGKAVDVVGHSMGGLISRYAVAATARGEAGFPPSLLVEDVVTLGTPHAGSDWSWGCAYTECVEMRPGSSFLGWLATNATDPQATGGTDWTVVGSEDDGIVPATSAVSMAARHKVQYRWYEGIDHIDYIIDTWNFSDRDVYKMTNNSGVWLTDYNHPRAVKRTDYGFVYGSW